MFEDNLIYSHETLLQEKNDIAKVVAKRVLPSAPPIEEDLELISNPQSLAFIKDEDACKICMNNYLECVFYDCGHMVCCMNCSIGLIHCPVCRNKIIQSIKVFK